MGEWRLSTAWRTTGRRSGEARTHGQAVLFLTCPTLPGPHDCYVSSFYVAVQGRRSRRDIGPRTRRWCCQAFVWIAAGNRQARRRRDLYWPLERFGSRVRHWESGRLARSAASRRGSAFVAL